MREELLGQLIDNSIVAGSRADYSYKMQALTELVDGIYRQDEKGIEFREISALTCYDVAPFLLSDFDKCLRFALSCGLDNQVILKQQNTIQAGIIDFEEQTVASLDDVDSEEDNPAGYVVLFNSQKRDLEEIKDRFRRGFEQADYHSLFILQEEKGKKVLGIEDKKKLVKGLKASSILSVPHKGMWAEYRAIMPIRHYRDDLFQLVYEK